MAVPKRTDTTKKMKQKILKKKEYQDLIDQKIQRIFANIAYIARRKQKKSFPQLKVLDRNNKRVYTRNCNQEKLQKITKIKIKKHDTN